MLLFIVYVCMYVYIYIQVLQLFFPPKLKFSLCSRLSLIVLSLAEFFFLLLIFTSIHAVIVLVSQVFKLMVSSLCSAAWLSRVWRR